MDQKNKMNFTLIQLGRIGDLLQTISAISYPEEIDIEFTLICRKSFGQPIKFLLEKHFKTIHYIDTDSLFAHSSSLEESSARLQTVLADIEQGRHDALINLTFSKPAAYLMTLLKSEVKIGQFHDGSQSFRIDDQWSRYIYSTSSLSR